MALRNNPLRHSYFVHTPCREIYRSRKNRFLINRAHPIYIPRVIDFPRRAGVHDAQIAYLSLYQGQLGLMRRHETPALSMMIVDQAQGRKFDIVLLNLVTPGGASYHLGFSTDVRRICVGLSRARIGILTFGDRHTGNIKYSTNGSRVWKNLIQDHFEHGVFRGHTINPSSVLSTYVRDPVPVRILVFIADGVQIIP